MSKDKSSQGKRNRRNGQKGQRHVANNLGVVYPFACSGSQYRGGSTDGCDVERTPWYIEVKNTKTLSIPGWWDKLLKDKEESKDGREPLLVFKNPKTKKYQVTLDFDTFVQRERNLNKCFSIPVISIVPDNQVSEIYQGEHRIGFIDLSLEDKFLAYTNTGEPVLNTRKGSEGTWSTEIAAEVAIRRHRENLTTKKKEYPQQLLLELGD